MEEGEREGAEDELGTSQSRPVSVFATKLSSLIIKEVVGECGVVEPIWSITCSSDCHDQDKKLQAEGEDVDGEVSKSGLHLCWTPESPRSPSSQPQGSRQSHCRHHNQHHQETECQDISLIALSNPCDGQVPVSDSSPKDCKSGSHSSLASAKEYLQELSGVTLHQQGVLTDPTGIMAQSAEHLPSDHTNGYPSASLRKGMSVNDVTVGDESLDNVCSENTLKNTKTGFLRQLGRGWRRRGLGREEEGKGRRGMRSIRKTLSSLFSVRSKWRDDGEEESGTSKRPMSVPGVGMFRRNKNVPPSKRALPPVPPVDLPPAVTLEPSSLRSSTPDPLRQEQESLPDMDPTDPWPLVTEHSPEQPNRLSPDLPGPRGQIDFAASIEKVKDHGWYWGPISGEAAERILAKEPDGSFVVRDSSDHHYIFSLTFKLNGFVRHVRIEHDQGNFSFGSFTKFKSNTIVDFIENAVEHSRSGRYLFFLHRRPVLGPMRVQLLHPVSRFKRVQSLQHMCRYIIVKHVRRDLLNLLPVPTRLKNYLNTPFYYSEQVAEEAESNPSMHVLDMEDRTMFFSTSRDTSPLPLVVEESAPDMGEELLVTEERIPRPSVVGNNEGDHSTEVSRTFLTDPYDMSAVVNTDTDTSVEVTEEVLEKNYSGAEEK